VYVAAALELRDGDRSRLEALTRAPSVRAGLATRARIVLLAAEGVANTDIAERTGTSRPTVLKWRGRYEQSGVEGLDDDPRPGREPVIDEVAVLAETLADKGKPPAHLGVTHWSTRLMAERLGISFASVARIWRKWGIQPHRVETFKFSTDPQLEAKLRDVVGLYLDPLPARWCSAATRKTRSRRWIEPSRFCRCAKAFPSSRPTITSATARPACSPRWRSPPARSPPTPATRVTPTSSSWPFSSWSPRPSPGAAVRHLR